MKRVHVGCLLAATILLLAVHADGQEQVLADPNKITAGTSGRIIKSYQDIALPLRDRLLEDIVAVPSTDSAVPTHVRVTLPDLGLVTLELIPVSIRGAGYTLSVQKPDGTIESIEPGPEATYTGRVLERPGSKVAASIVRLNLFAMIRLEAGETYWVQPLWDAAQTLKLDFSPCPTIHLAYRGSDTKCAGRCSQPDVDPPAGNSGDLPLAHGGCGTNEVPCIAELAIDVDFEYFQARGSIPFNVEDRVSAIINVVNHQFQRDVFLTHRLATIRIRQSEPDPYTAAGAADLLNQVQTEWVANGGGVPRDLTQLLTGRDLTGSDTGAAFDAAVCDDDLHYSVVQSDFSPLFACVTDNSAHFLGHLWGATHCACPASTMNATLSCANSFTGAGASSVDEINNFLESATCLSSEGFAPPNDRCDHATVITATGAYVGSNSGASNDGGTINGPFNCGTPGGGVRDIFWTFTPAASVPIAISTCGTSFDTVLSVHTGCPATPANLVNCNDDCSFPGPCPFTIQSCFTFNGVAGQTYYARASGFTGANVGPITLIVTLPAAPACAGDLDCDDDRDPDDIPDFVQALVDPGGYTATHGACPIGRANLNGDGAIDGRDVAAFTALLTGGACP